MNFYAVGGGLNASAIAEILSLRGDFAIDAKLEAAGRGHAEARLIGNTMRTHLSGDGRIRTQATDEPIILVLCRGGGGPVPRSGACNGRLAHLNLCSIRIPKRHVLSHALEIVDRSVNGGDVRVAPTNRSRARRPLAGVIALHKLEPRR